MPSRLQLWQERVQQLVAEKPPVLLTLILAPTSSKKPDSIFTLGMDKFAPSFQKFERRGIWTPDSASARATVKILSQEIWPPFRIITNPELQGKRYNETKKEAKERIYREIRMIAQHAFDTRNAAIILHPRTLQIFLIKITLDTTMPLMRPGSISYMIYHPDTDSFSVIRLNKTTYLDQAEAELRFLDTDKNHK
ncbi:MAG: hypothetical protein G01um101433_918 [Parcubacteria group bacterium Gr01-1014_33]|nr:MAG: hypothetical protein G01um101433_918 [Parcubacteria group bacterium Gr01-1014_33]